MTEITAIRTQARNNPVFYVAEINSAHRNPASSRPAMMSVNDPTSPESEPSIKPKRTFPWDYTTSGKRPTAVHVPELVGYIPRKPEDMSSNGYGHQPTQPTARDRPRVVRFASDNPSFDELSSRNYQEKYPHTRDQTYDRTIPPKDVEPGLQRKYPPSSPEEENDHEKKKKSNCKFCVLIIIVIILLLLLITMTGLFIWRMVCCNKKNDGLLLAPTPIPATSPSGCKANPNPVVFTTLPQRVLKELDNFSTFLDKEVDKNQAAAVSVNIVYGDKVIWEKGLGVLNKTEKPLRSPNSGTMYPCASVSKALTALVLFKLVNDKRVQQLDDKVVKYETGFSVKNPFNNLQITLRELAAQRSGLKREAPCYPVPEGSTNLCPYDYNTMLDRIKNLTLIRSPGSKPQYSNLGYGLLGRVLWKSFSSGLNFDQWMKKEIFSKLNMMSSTFSPSNSQKLKMPVGYLDSTYVNPIYEWGWLQPTGGMFSTVEDLAKLLIELMTNKPDNDRFISTSLTEELFKPDYVFPDSKTMTGTPWEMKQHDGYIIRQKFGYIYGYNSYVAMVPEIRLGMNMFCTDCQQKSGSSIPKYFEKIISVFKEEFVSASTKNFTLPADTKPFIGQYNSTIPTLRTIQIKEKTNYLTFVLNEFDIFFMNSTGPLTFKISVNPEVDCMTVFTLGVENEVLLFDKPSPRDGKSPGFFMYGATVDGRTYFTRAN